MGQKYEQTEVDRLVGFVLYGKSDPADAKVNAIKIDNDGLLHSSSTVEDYSVSGTIVAANGTVEIAYEGKQSCAAIISGTWTGTLIFQGSCDEGVSWSTYWVSSVNQSIVALGIPTPTQSISANGTYKVFQSSGVTHYRIKASTLSLGTVNVILTAVNSPASFIYTASSIIQQAVVDSNNSSTTNLQEYEASASTDTFTGVSTSTLGVAGIQVSLKTDQNCTIYIEQSPEGTNWDLSDVFNYYASINNFGVTVQAINSYVRIRVINLGSVATTYFRLQTVLCPIVESLPRSLDENQNLKVAIQSIKDEYGFTTENTPNNELRVVTPFRLVGAQFSGTTLDTNFWTSSLGVGGSAEYQGSQVVLSTGTTVNNNVSLQTTRTARYIGGSAHRFRGIIRLPNTTTTNNTRRWGAFTSTNGCFFEFTDTVFKIVTRNSGHDTVISSGSFNGTLGAIYKPDNNVHAYEIYYNNSKVYFSIGGLLLHTVSANTDVWTSDIHLPVRIENNNTNGNTANLAINCRAITIARLGRESTQGISKYQSGTTTGIIYKYGPGLLHKLLVSNVSNTSNITFYDNIVASGTIIWSSGSMGSQTTPFSIDCGELPFFTGLTIVISGANCNVTTVYE